jgi:hypothetical protein
MVPIHPPLVDDNIEYNNNGSEIIEQVFDDSFTCSPILAGIYLTEWYLAGVYGWTTTTSTSITVSTTVSSSTTVTAPAKLLNGKKSFAKDNNN